LEAAALLHDVGQYIAYSRHHKHSHYLIMNTELAEYSEREKTIIANVARYHRRGLPKSDHIDFMRLSALDRELVTKLSAILRIADGLDRSHSSFIKDLWVKVKDNTIEFGVTASEDIAAERSGFDKKKDLLQLITGREALLL
ncbi:MAG: HD domain-containing protein, partial [Deferribacterales bacterium]|nr:HD domain-containing protein [Deferribacterales bacterium]